MSVSRAGTGEQPVVLTVATYNLYLGADLTVVFDVASREELAVKAGAVLDQVLATDFAARAEAIAAIVVREHVDVLGLQEVARWSTVSENGSEVWLDFLGVLLEALERAGEVYDVHASTPNFRGGAVIDSAEISVHGHNVILVRRSSGVRVTSERVGGFADALRITTGTPDVVFEIARSWSAVDAQLEGRAFTLVNTHHEAWDEDTRNAQRDELLRALVDSGRPVLVVGDFNAPPERVGMPPEFVDAWAVAGHGPGLTCGRRGDLRDGRLHSRIDYVWVRGAGVEECRVVGADEKDRTASGLWPSDHAGVVAHIAL